MIICCVCEREVKNKGLLALLVKVPPNQISNSVQLFIKEADVFPIKF